MLSKPSLYSHAPPHTFTLLGQHPGGPLDLVQAAQLLHLLDTENTPLAVCCYTRSTRMDTLEIYIL